MLARVVLDIHRLRLGKTLKTVPPFSLHQVHPLDRDTALATLHERISALTAAKAELLSAGVLDTATLIRHIPSVSAIKVVEVDSHDAGYIAFEGNGRLVAMQTVFDESDNLSVEVEVYTFAKSEKIVRRLRRIQRMNRLPVT